MLLPDYLALFDQILRGGVPVAPYDDPEYFNYTKLNESRFKRWLKTMELDSDLIKLLERIEEKQHWIIITEPWCGDASHVVPFLIRMAEIAPKISYELQLRDAEPFLIDSYLTNGGKAIPKIISRNESGEDVFVWGPRPAGAQALMNRLKQEEAPFETIKVELQNWYNADKGTEIKNELKAILSDFAKK